jgi:capping protein beta
LDVEVEGWCGADTDRYFEGGISSVYLWDMDDGFAGCVLLKKGACGSTELL